MSDKKDLYDKFLKTLETRDDKKWTVQLEKYLEDGGEVKICLSCNAPTFGHVDTHCRELKSKKYSDEEAIYFETELLKEVQTILMSKKTKTLSYSSENDTLTLILSKLSQSMIETQQFQKMWIEKNENRFSPKATKLVKPPKPPVWTKEMVFETFEKQISRWSDNEKEVTEVEKYHELIEELKKNKEINGLSVYVNDQIIETCNDETDQTIKRILDVLKIKYGRTELEKMELLWDSLINFKVDKELDSGVILDKLKK